MPEIKLGSSKNARNINLGSKEIEEVRLGRVLVWQNNIAPQIVLTNPEVGEYGDLNFPIGVTIATSVNIVFSAQDLDPLDTIVSYAVDGPPLFTPVPTTPITPGNPVSGLTFTIPNTLFLNPGEPTTNNVFTVTVTDQRGKDGIYTVTVIGVSIEPPVVSVQKQFGSYESIGETLISKNAIFLITQPQSVITAGYTAQYSIDGGVNWITGTSTSEFRAAKCGQSVTVTVLGRSVKTGQTTAYASSPASSTLSVSAPSAAIPVSFTNCDYSRVEISGNVNGQTCSGTMPGAGSTRSLYIKFHTGNGEQYTGTRFPSLHDQNGVVNSPIDEQARSVRFTPSYIVPSSLSGTNLSYSCQGGDYRQTLTQRPYVNVVPGTEGAKGSTSKVGGLYNFGPDFKYTTLSIQSDFVQISTTPENDYGVTSYKASFLSLGRTQTQPYYYGDFRLANGTSYSIGRTDWYYRYFETYATCRPAGYVEGDYCNGTIFTEQVADGNCGITFRKTQVVGKCGYVPPPSAYYTATPYCSVITRALQLDGFAENGARLVIQYDHSFQGSTAITLGIGKSATVTVRSGIEDWSGFSFPGNDPGGTVLASSQVFTSGNGICEGNGAGQIQMVPNPISS